MERMPFGKYKGKLLDELPDTYLLWLKDQELSSRLKQSIDNVIKNKTRYKIHNNNGHKIVGYYNPLTETGGKISYNEYIGIK